MALLCGEAVITGPLSRTSSESANCAAATLMSVSVPSGDPGRRSVMMLTPWASVVIE